MGKLITEKQWEVISEHDHHGMVLRRLEIFGGWLVAHSGHADALTFVPDPKHEWVPANTGIDDAKRWERQDERK